MSRTGSLSHVFKGTAFEERSLHILQSNLSMTLRRVGGKSDGGIDLLGWWWLPPTDGAHSHVTRENWAEGGPRRRRLRVFAQCKAERRKSSPKYVREMEGVLHRHLPLAQSWPPALKTGLAQPLVALLISESPFTKSTLLRAQSSPVPFFLLHLPPVSAESLDCGELGGAFWNPALASTQGLLGGQMEARWERSADGTGSGRPGIWWHGRRLGNWTPDMTPEVAARLDEEEKLFAAVNAN